MYTLYR